MTRPALTLVGTTGTPPTFPVAQASAALERAWHAVNAAQDAFSATPVGDTEALLARRDAWVVAIGEYERARLVLAEVVKRQAGRTGLRMVLGGRS